MSTVSDDLTKEDFMQSGWEDIIAQCNEKECAFYSSRFNAKALEAEGSGSIKEQRVLGLLSSVTSMYFKLDTPEAPFGPMMVFHDRRTAIVDGFDENQLKLFSDVVNDISDPELRARIADVLWLRERDYHMAELAILSYLESAKSLEDPEKWMATADRVERALQLATLLGGKAPSFSVVISHIENVLAAYNGEDPLFLSAKMMNLLQERGVGDSLHYASLSEKLASRAESTHDWDRASRSSR